MSLADAPAGDPDEWSATLATTLVALFGATGFAIRGLILRLGAKAVEVAVAARLQNNIDSAPVRLSKAGPGTLVLTCANTSTGGTTVTGGTLRVDGSLGTTAVGVSGGSLDGIGTLNGPLAVNGGTLAPGNSIGTLVVNSNLTVANGATIEAELGAGGTADRVDMSGGAHTLNLANGSTVGLVSSGFTRPATPTTFTLADLQSDGASLLQLNGVNLAAGTDITVYTADGLGGGSFSTINGSVTLTASGFSSLLSGDTLTLRRSTGGDLVVVFTPVPEPGTVLLGGVGVLGLVRLVRFARRRSQAV